MNIQQLPSNYNTYKKNGMLNKKIMHFILNLDSNNQKIYNFVNKINSNNSLFDYIITTKRYNKIFLLNNIIIDINNKKIILIPNLECNNKLYYNDKYFNANLQWSRIYR